MLAQPFRAIRAFGIGHLDNNMLKFRNIADCRDQIIMQIFGASGQIIFHQGQTNALSDTAFNLAFNKQWVDRPTDIMGGCHFIEAHLPQPPIDRQLNHLCAISIDRIGATLPIFIQRRCWRVIGFLAHKHIAIIIHRQR